MVSFTTLAAAVLLSATAATPAFAQAPLGAPPVVVPGGVSSSDRALYIQKLHDSGYNPKNDFNPNGTIRAAIQEPGLFSFYYPNLDVLNGGAPTPAARLSRDWPALKGACASAGGATATALMISRLTHSRVTMAAAVTGCDSTSSRFVERA